MKKSWNGRKFVKRKVFSILLVFVMILPLVACGRKQEPSGAQVVESESGSGTADGSEELMDRNRGGNFDDDSAGESGEALNRVYGDSLIEESFSEEGEFKSDWDEDMQEYSYHVPRLAGDTAAIRAINQELGERVGEEARSNLETIKQDQYCMKSRIGWTSHWQGSLLSLVVAMEDAMGLTEYLVIHYDYDTDERLDNAQMLKRQGISERDALRAIKRAAAQNFDRGYYKYPHFEYDMNMYYGSQTDAQIMQALLLQRANLVAAQNLDTALLFSDGGKCYYLAPSLQDGEYRYEAVELCFDEPTSPSEMVKDHIVTATLENNKIFLTFADTEEAAYYLLGYGDEGFDYEEGGRGYELPGDRLALGPNHRYEVQGLFSNYRDIFLGGLGREYLPYLFLVTEDNGLEMVDIVGCFRYGVFCAMPIPGLFDENLLPEEILEDDYGQLKAIVGDKNGDWYDPSVWAIIAKRAVPQGMWSGVVEEVQAAGGSYSKVANLDFRDESASGITVTELDAETYAGDIWMTTLGMTEEGMVCGYTCSAWDETVAGAFVYSTGFEATEEWYYETLQMKVISGTSPFEQEGEELVFYKNTNDEEYGWTEGSGAAGDDLYAGEWCDVNSGRCYMAISYIEAADLYSVEISWGDSAFTTYEWTMTATRGLYDEALYYEDCEYKCVSYNSDGTLFDTVLSTDGTGCLVMDEAGRLLWQDDDDRQQSDRCCFERLDSNY